MSESAGLSDQYRKSSPWPMLIAFGLALSEVGIIFGIYAFTVGGLLLLVGSVSGVLRETAYVDDPWLTLGGLGVVAGVIGVAIVWATGGASFAGSPTAVEVESAIGARGLAIAVAGLFCVLGAFLGRTWTGTRATPS